MESQETGKDAWTKFRSLKMIKCGLHSYNVFKNYDSRLSRVVGVMEFGAITVTKPVASVVRSIIDGHPAKGTVHILLALPALNIA